MKAQKYYDKEKIVRVWEILHDHEMHVGYFLPGVESMPEASKELTKKMISMVDIKPLERFIDFGCGFGVPASRVQKKTKCYIDAVTISTVQKQKAEETINNENIKFHLADATNLPFKEKEFDGGWFFESIFHMGHTDALKEASRVLKPGATLVIADIVKKGFMNPLSEFIRKKVFACKTFVKINDYPKMMKKHGFTITEIVDVSPCTVDVLEDRYLEALNKKIEQVKKIFKDEREFKSFMKTFKFVNRLLANSKYILVKAVKN